MIEIRGREEDGFAIADLNCGEREERGGDEFAIEMGDLGFLFLSGRVIGFHRF